MYYNPRLILSKHITTKWYLHDQAFVESTVDIFYATGRGKNVTIKVEFSADPSVPLSEPVDPTDLISIDKFKTSQVVIRSDSFHLVMM